MATCPKCLGALTEHHQCPHGLLRRMTDSYWELRYETGQLKSRVTRLEVQVGLRTADPEPEAPAPPNKTSFVPLSSLKK